ncbi:MAG: hypothetical protein ACXADA_16215 [Candidatus Hodarchaeales archaeon]
MSRNTAKILQNVIPAILIALIFLLSGCTNPTSPTNEIDDSLLQELSGVPMGQGVEQTSFYDFYEQGPHSVVLLDSSGNKHNWTDNIPLEWRSQGLEDVELVITAGEEKEMELEVCYYDGPSITRIQFYREFVLREAKTAEIVDTFRIYGTEPRECRTEEDYSITRLEGSHIEFEQLKNRLESYILPDITPSLKDLLWAKKYGGTEAYSVTQTLDGGFAIVGYTKGHETGDDILLIKINKFGYELWNKTYSNKYFYDGEYFSNVIDVGRTIISTSDGGFGILGESAGQMWLLKTDADGNVHWNKTFGGQGMNLIQTIDGGFAAVGFSESYGDGSNDFWLVKTGASGNLEWNKTYGGTDSEYGSALVQMTDGGFAIIGTYVRRIKVTGGTDDRNSVLLIKTDNMGNQEWNTTFQGNERIEFSVWYSTKLIQTDDGGFAFIGSNNTFMHSGRDIWLTKIDSSGNLEWEQTYEGSDDEIGRSLVQHDDGGFILACDVYKDSSFPYLLLIKTGTNGDIQWEQTFQDLYKGYSADIITTSDSGFAIAGSYITPSGSYEISNFWLLKSKKPAE